MRDVTSHAPSLSPVTPSSKTPSRPVSVATAPKHVSSSLAARMQKFEAAVQKNSIPLAPTPHGSALPRSSFSPGPTQPLPTPIRRLSYTQKVTVEASKVDPTVTQRRSSVASQRESITREKFDDSLPQPSGSGENLSPKIVEAIETLRETVVAKNPVSDVFVPPVLSQQNSTRSFQSIGGGVGDKCHQCSKTVYAMEKIVYDDFTFHRSCLKCKHCGTTLKLGNVACLENEFFCKPHFKQLFALKGNYNEGFGRADPKKTWGAK
ncbi:hypothetical protein BCR33DRAFT_724436 [Rhizoclosmatium globosum]|uniref:LIM zinc-binding domain-containing protein n=1 Tax=Rhizoclosmatium globosum TaxID=329046 RepID=A0A1Y2B5K2_9FUNG|nr:hypothetical protein BCR33DRAFT_724436 [Rhizoclosmatium globosum]|eukprot:ORY30122.1 hypothetical protein BCR33DRAFT_724436 [Rhizoclosmatium globosum]